VSLVLDLRIDRFGSSSDPSLNGNFHYPHNIDLPQVSVISESIKSREWDDPNTRRYVSLTDLDRL
jgi:hypothetical protein